MLVAMLVGPERSADDSSRAFGVRPALIRNDLDPVIDAQRQFLIPLGAGVCDVGKRSGSWL